MRHTSDNLHIDHVALAILRQADQIVMVQQHTPDTHQPYWVLPGGLVEAGELVSDGLIREVKEESGVDVMAIGHLACLSQIDRPAHTAQTIAFIFEIGSWHGALQPQDPDREVTHAELVPKAEAISRLQQNGGWPGIGDPLLAYLRGEMSSGALWFYREAADGQQLVSMLPPNLRE